MKKKICLIATALLLAAASLMSVSCTEEFQVEKSQLYGTWYFPVTLPADTVTGFNWAGEFMTINNNDTLLVSALPGKRFDWILRGNTVTATCTPRANVDEHYVVTFTVYEATATTLDVKGKYRYIYEGDNQPHGTFECKLNKNQPAM